MLTVAIVDPDSESRLLLTLILEERFKVNAFANASEALTGLRICQPDVVLVALSLPDMDGLAFLAHMRREPVLRALPVVAMAEHDAGADPRLREAGFSRFLRQPIADEPAFLELLTGLARRVTQPLSLSAGFRLEDLVS